MSKSFTAEYLIEEERRKRIEQEIAEKKRLEEERLKKARLRQKQVDREKEKLIVLNEIKTMEDKHAKSQAKPKPIMQKKHDVVGKNQAETNKEPDISKMVATYANAVKEESSLIPSRWKFLYKDRLLEIDQYISEVENDQYEAFHLSKIKYYREEMSGLVKNIKETASEYYSRRLKLRSDFDQIYATVQMICAEKINDNVRKRGESIILKGEELFKSNDLNTIEKGLTFLKQETADLESIYLTNKQKEETDRYVLENVKDVLKDLGYEVYDFATTMSADSSKKDAPLFLRAPDEGLIRIGLNRNEQISTKFLVPVNENHTCDEDYYSKMQDNCRQWCDDLKNSLKLLHKRGLKFTITEDIDPDLDDLDEIEVDYDFFEQPDVAYRSTTKNRKFLRKD